MDEFEAHRPLLFGIAYRMLGSVMEAEDIVQEAYLRFRSAPADEVRSARAYLCAIVTRLCLDHLKSARAQRETYIGPWLPAPLLTDTAGPAGHAELTDSLSIAFMLLLETLTPAERAVFLLREVFDFSYGEIAAIVGKEEAACRQLLHRARQRVRDRRPRFDTSAQAHEAILQRFLHAAETGDLTALLDLMTEDVVAVSDGGGKVAASRYPLAGRDRVARLVRGLPRLAPPGVGVEIASINGEPAIVIRFANGDAYGVISADLRDGKIAALHFILNPDKLAHLNP